MWGNIQDALKPDIATSLTTAPDIELSSNRNANTLVDNKLDVILPNDTGSAAPGATVEEQEVKEDESEPFGPHLFHEYRKHPVGSVSVKIIIRQQLLTSFRVNIICG